MLPRIELPTWLYHNENEPLIANTQDQLEFWWAKGYRDSKAAAKNIQIVEDEDEDEALLEKAINEELEGQEMTDEAKKIIAEKIQAKRRGRKPKKG